MTLEIDERERAKERGSVLGSIHLGVAKDNEFEEIRDKK